MSESTVSTSCAAAPTPTLAERAQAVRAGGSPVPSPCIAVCCIDEARGWCSGCLRTRDELRAWRELDDAGKRVIWARIEQRLATPEQST